MVDLNRDLEIIDLAVAYNLYVASLINLKSAMDREVNPELASTLEKVREYAANLRGHFTRCKLKADVPTSFPSSQEISTFLASAGLMVDLANQLAGLHSRKEESLFMLACNLGLLLAAPESPSMNVTPLRSSIESLGRQAGLPDKLIRRLLDSPETGFAELRSHRRTASNSSIAARIWDHYGRQIIIGVTAAVVAGLLLAVLL